MIKFIRAITVITLTCINITVLGSIFFILLILKNISPTKKLKHILFLCSEQTYHAWVDINTLIFKTCLPTKWDCDIQNDISNKAWYALVANHCSGVDILILQGAFNRKIPHLKFFMKDSLKWIPFAGQVCYLSNYPLIKRYTPSQIRKNPKLMHENVQSVINSCHNLKKQPTTIINFLEGTRLTPEKHKKSKSPYKNLLPPQAGGTAIVLNELQHEIKQVLDVTISYKKGATLVDFITGNIPKISIRYKLIEVDNSWHGDFYKDRGFRASIVTKLKGIWQDKDETLEQLSTETE